MKKDRNYGGTAPYPICPMYPGMMPQAGIPMNQFPMMQNQPYMTQDPTSGSIEQQLSSLNSQINSLERRVTNLENLIGNTNKYNNTNYQVM